MKRVIAVVLTAAMTYILAGCQTVEAKEITLSGNGYEECPQSATIGLEKTLKKDVKGSVEVLENLRTYNELDSIKYPVIKNSGNAAVEKVINEDIQKTFLGKDESNPDSEAGLEERRIEYVVVVVVAGMCLQVEKQVKITPLEAFHGNMSVEVNHYNLEKGEKITLQDMLANDEKSLKTLSAMVHQKVIQYMDEKGQFTDEVALNLEERNFKISEKGIAILFQPYEIASYSEGVVEIELPWIEVKPLLDSENKVVMEVAGS